MGMAHVAWIVLAVEMQKAGEVGKRQGDGSVGTTGRD